MAQDSARTITYRMKVVGVTSQNEGGSSRQDIIKQTKTDDPLSIEWDGSPDCPELLCVYDAKNRQLGNIKKELSKEIVHLYENHYISAKVVEVTGNEETHYSCEIEMTITPEPMERVPLAQKIALSDHGMFRREEEAQREAKKKKQLRDGTAMAVGSLIGTLLLNAFCAAIFFVYSSHRCRCRVRVLCRSAPPPSDNRVGRPNLYSRSDFTDSPGLCDFPDLRRRCRRTGRARHASGHQ